MNIEGKRLDKVDSGGMQLPSPIQQRITLTCEGKMIMTEKERQVNGKLAQAWPQDPDFFDTAEGMRYLEDMEDVYGFEPGIDVDQYWFYAALGD